MRQVTAFGEAHAHDRVARLGEGHQHRLVGLRTRIRLDVGAVGAEQGLEAIDRNLLDHVDVLATAVVALAGIAFGIFVGQLGALGFHYGLADVVLGCDQLDVILLAAILVFDRFPEFGINFRQCIFCGKHRMPHKPLKRIEL